MYSNSQPYSDSDSNIDPRQQSYAMHDRMESQRQSQSQQGYSNYNHNQQQQQYYDSDAFHDDDGYPACPVRFSRYELGNVAPRSAGTAARYNSEEYQHGISYNNQMDYGLSAPGSARNSLVMQRNNHNPNNPYSSNTAYDGASSTATFVEKSPALSSGSGSGWKMDNNNNNSEKRHNNKLGAAWPAPAAGLLARHHSENNQYDDEEDDHQIGMNWKRPNRKVLYTIIGIVARKFASISSTK